MFEPAMKAPFPQNIADLLARVGSRKRKAYVKYDAPIPTHGIKLASYWDGGSRDEFAAFTASGQAIALPISGAPQFSKEEPAWIPQSGDVLVEYGTFMGKPSTPSITFYK